LTPPLLEKIDFHRPMTGDKEVDFKKFRQRVGSLQPGHEVVSPYAHHLRVLLYDVPQEDVCQKFIKMCLIAGLSGSSIIRCSGPSNIEADGCGFFESKRLWRLEQEFNKQPWAIAFQLESLLRNGLLHTGDIEGLLGHVRLTYADHGAEYTGDLLRVYQEALEIRLVTESPTQCYHRVRGKFIHKSTKLPSGQFRCCHVTFTPTRTILEGPYAVQSNRVIRQYVGYEDHFLRVDFRDEDRLQYRWDREMDGSVFLQDRVGGILKKGFKIAGREFLFLAYSMSALREHSVWFINPFIHPIHGKVDSDFIRDSLGQFKGTSLMKMPSKLAARISQAFTATDPSVTIRRDQWEEVMDLGNEPYLFTDGVGTISKALGEEIWQKLCDGRRGDHSLSVKPSAVSHHQKGQVIG
jgi:RNA-dependent RNA polymerase